VSACSHGSVPPSPVASPASKSPATSVTGFFGSGFTPENYGSFGTDRMKLVAPDDARLASALQVVYPANSASQLASRDDDTRQGGAQLYLARRSGPVDSAYLSYYLRIPNGFDFVKGGKLPGLYGGRVTSGRHIPDGTNGFSTRYMWRKGGTGEVYAYLPTSVDHGTSLGRGSWQWPTGLWTHVQQHVVLNDPKRANGVLQVWLNGQLVLDRHDLLYRDTTALKIQGLFFSTFFGGGDQTWATPVDQRIEFSKFEISDKYVEANG
jgi:hypothetical protein